jgi:two-component system phosphate regulon sensor histidine kinase PhoR
MRRVLAKLTTKQAELELITANMSEGMLFIDGNGIVQFVNAAAFSLFNLEPYDCLGKAYIYFSNHKKLAKAVRKAENAKKYAKDIKLLNRILRLSAAPVHNEGTYSGVICIFSDVTEQRRAERIRRDFTANVSHELKTPLTSIIGYSELIAAGVNNSDDMQKFAGIIHTQSKHLLEIITEILTLSALESSNTTQQEELDLLEVAKDCVETLSLSVDRGNISINVAGESSLVVTDKTMLKHLLTNLIDNAVRYNVDGGKVLVSVDGETITVADTGVGIAEADQERIFERFYRVDKGRGKQSGGTGLGLAIVKHIAERIDATISLTSKIGKGTTVKVMLG